MNQQQQQQQQSSTVIDARINNIFQKISTLKSANDQSKNQKLQVVQQVLVNLEDNYQQVQQSKNEKYQYLSNKVEQLVGVVEGEHNMLKELQADVQRDVLFLQKHSRNILQEYTKQQEVYDQERLQFHNRRILQIQQQIQQQNIENVEQQQQVSQVINKNIPDLKQRLQQQINSRKQESLIIMKQFEDQLARINESLDKEAVERDRQFQCIVDNLAAAANRVKMAIKKNNQDRQSNEQNIIHLLEKVIENLNHDVSI